MALLLFKCSLTFFIFSLLSNILNMSSIIDENNYYGGEQDVTEAVKIRLYPTLEQKKIGEEEWICPQCGKHHDRDLNASINIKMKD